MDIIAIRKHVVDKNGELLKKPESAIDKYVKPKRQPHKIILIILAVLVIGVLGWLSIKAYLALGKIITKNTAGSAPFLSFLGNVQANQLKGEGDGRINILIFGIGGANHPGGQLADTIMVASFNPKDKSLVVLSIPRDLYVPIPGHGSDKINSAHSSGITNKDDSGGSALLKKTVSEILDLPIHYFIRVDFAGFIKLVDTIGGVKVEVEKAISDPYYPDKKMIGYDPFSITAGSHQLNGETALKYARSRETTSDFDRSKRQQQIILAMRDKVLSLGILANPQKISDILSILGNHVKTDMQLWEMERFLSIVKELDTAKIANKVLDNQQGGLLTNANNLGGYYLVPRAGTNNFKEIQRYVHEFLADPYLAEESAKIEILNASGTNGLANKVSETLTSYGYHIVKIDKNNKTLNKTVIYDYSDGKKPFTVQFLSNRFAAEVKTQPKPANSQVDISLVIGKDYQD